MDFKQSIDKYLNAVEKKDLVSLKKLIPAEGPISGLLVDGTVLEDVESFVAFHEDWFGTDGWGISHEVVSVEETSEMGFAVCEVSYFGKEDNGDTYHIGMHSSYIMRNCDGKWLLVHQQQTETMEEE